jgi:protein-tyrosine phosphatase
MHRIKVIFVCLGNICRSPLAQGAFQALVDERGLSQHFVLDSAGTGAWHVGENPDPRSVRTAAQHQVDIAQQRGRVFIQEDMKRFDYIFAMDLSNQRDIIQRHTDGHSTKVHLFLERTVGKDAEVPDPYYGRSDGFEHVWSLVLQAGEAWLNEICKQHDIVA